MPRYGIILMALLCAGLITFAAADDEPAHHRHDNAAMMAEIDAVLARQDAAVAGLRARLREAADEGEALALLREIDLCRRDAEIAVLKVQQSFALRDGDAAAAARIGQAIDALTTPVRAQPNPQAEQARRARTAGGAGHE